jgi:hypothetical protein
MARWWGSESPFLFPGPAEDFFLEKPAQGQIVKEKAAYSLQISAGLLGLDGKVRI